MTYDRRSTILPYHFVPVTSGPRRDDVAVEGFRSSPPAHLGHHQYVGGGRSGRLVVRLTTESPTFVGAQRQPGGATEAARVEPFELHDRPAIPGSSLRGMISSLAEAASEGALRVLDDRVFSYRAAMRGALSAIGEVVVEQGGAEPRYFLRPVCLPTIKCHGREARLPYEYRGWFSAPRLKVYIGRNDVHGHQLETWTAETPRFYGVQLGHPPELRWVDGKVPSFLVGSGGLLMSQKLDQRPAPVPWDEIPEGERHLYTRGIVRVMKGPGGEPEMPENRKHELFLPYDPGQKLFPILPEAVCRFHDLADEMTQAHQEGKGPLLPHSPYGAPRNPDPEDRRFRLKTGDLVYFKPADGGEAVGEIALSSIWRSRVEDSKGQPYKAWSFFRAVDPELVPFHAERRVVTLAEQLFGFVPEGDAAEEGERQPALRSRVRFSDARLEETGNEEPYFEQCPLAILDAPKPPSPDLYFIDVGGGRVTKEKLQPGRHRPQGRKHYVHQRWRRGTDPASAPWVSRVAEHENMKSRIRPLRDGLTFLFHVDYDNLTDLELGLLLYALRPTEEFLHKIGMGKPLGLGTVRLDVIALLEVDRQQRYRAAGLFAPRYRRAVFAEDEDPSAWPERYRAERETPAGPENGPDFPASLRRRWRDEMSRQVRSALERLGETLHEPQSVSLPLVEGGDKETETFAWFVVNDRFHLRPLAAEEEWPSLPILKARTKKPSGHRPRKRW